MLRCAAGSPGRRVGEALADSLHVEPDVGEPDVALLPEESAFPPASLLLSPIERSAFAFAQDQDVFVLVGNVRPDRQHPGPHEFVGRIRLLVPEYVGQSGESAFKEAVQDSGMIGIQLEIAIQGPGRIADINAGKAARFQNPAAFVPGRIENLVHEVESPPPGSLSQAVADLPVLRNEYIVPHGHHRIRRRGDNQVNRRIRDLLHRARRTAYQSRSRFHAIPPLESTAFAAPPHSAPHGKECTEDGVPCYNNFRRGGGKTSAIVGRKKPFDIACSMGKAVQKRCISSGKRANSLPGGQPNLNFLS